jgi:spoIIIJ-associated protein
MSKTTIKKHIDKILEFIDVSPDIKISKDDDAFRIDIKGDDLSFLIGYRGESLDALQYILSHAVYKAEDNWIPLTLDINGYRQSKLDKLEETVKDFVDRVRFHQKEMRLPPLTPFERRHVHMLISEYIDVDSVSRGEGRNRRLFIIPAKK